MKEIVTVAVVAILIFAFFEYAASPTIEGGLANLSSNENAVQAPWENHLTEVIDYFNTYVQDNYTIITAYALHLAYFTGHPVIEMFYYDGEMDIIKLNETVTNDYVGLLTAQDVHYLLLPKPSNSMYANYLTLSKELPILNINFISSQPGVILLRNFTDFLLYRLVPKQEQSQSFAYLSNFTDGWVPIGNSTFMSFGHSPSSVIIQGTTTLPILGIGNQGGFWQTAKSNVSDRISVSENSQFGVNGSNSLQIAVNGTGNMVISHTYTKPQDFSGLGIVSFLLHGADSNRQIDFTFHTIEWEDYYTYYINDNFTGWRSFSISERSFTPEGSPSWGSISYIEIRFSGQGRNLLSQWSSASGAGDWDIQNTADVTDWCD